MFLKNAISYTAANSIGQLARLLQELALRVVLSPQMLGIWNYVTVLQSFTATFDLGVLPATTRHLALLHGANEVGGISRTRATALLLELAQRSLMGIAVVVYLLLTRDQRSSMEFWAGISAFILLIAAGFGESFSVFYQGEQRYAELGRKLAAYWFLQAGLMAGGAFFAGVPGLIAGNFLSFVIYAVLLWNGLAGLGWRGVLRNWSLAEARSLLSFGVPLRVVDSPMTLFMMLDLLFITRFMSLESLAIFSTAKLIMNQAGQVMAWFSGVVITRLTTWVGAGGRNKKELGKEIARVLDGYYLLLLPLGITLAMHGTVVAVKLVIPQYHAALAPLPVLLFSIYFLPQVTIIRNFWIIEKRFKPLFVTNVSGLLFRAVGFGLLLWTSSVSEVSVAGVCLITSAMYFAPVGFSIGREIWDRPTGSRVLVSILASMILTFAGIKLSGVLELAFQQEASWGARIGAFVRSLVVISPLLVYGVFQTGIYHRIRELNRRPSFVR